MIIKKKYISIAKISMQNSLAYRSSFIINIIASLIGVVSLFFLWKAIFGGHSILNGYTWAQMKAYLLITFITNSLLTWYSETSISWKILDGSVAMDLLKPLDFQSARLAETLGTSVFESLIGIVLTAIILLIFSGIIIPTNIGVWLMFLVSLIAAVFTKFGVIYIAGLLCFWTSSAVGVAWARAAITNFFSGALVPLVFFPEWLKNLSLMLPFKGIVYIPASIYLGNLSGRAALEQIGVQLVWLVILFGISKLLWKWAVRQVTIYGG